MRRLALILFATSLMGAASSEAKQSLCERAYVARVKVVHQYGNGPAGRNICRHGVIAHTADVKGRTHTTTRPASVKEKYLYWVYLRSLARPAPPYLGKVPSRPRRGRAGVMSWRYVPVGEAACIVWRESRGNPQANNGSHFGLAQWAIATWQRHRGPQITGASSPLGASAQAQLLVLSWALSHVGDSDWRAYDGCS